MKIAINFENLPKDGGAFHENILLSDVFKSFDNSKYTIVYIVSDKNVEKILKERNLKTIFFNKNLIFRFQNAKTINVKGFFKNPSLVGHSF